MRKDAEEAKRERDKRKKTLGGHYGSETTVYETTFINHFTNLQIILLYNQNCQDPTGEVQKCGFRVRCV